MIGHNYFKEKKVGDDTMQLIISLILFTVAPKFTAEPPSQLEINVNGTGN